MATDERNIFTLRQEDCEPIAQYLAMHGVRNNTELEDLHSGTSPSSKTGDYSDVYVVSPYGKIPWNEVSRINDPEMRSLMLSVEKALTIGLKSLTVFEDEQLKALPTFVKQTRTYDSPYFDEYLKSIKTKRSKEG